MSDVDLKRPEISLRILRCALIYYENTYGREALDRVVADLGLPSDYLAVESNWVSFKYLEDVLERMTQASGDADFAYHAGLLQSDRDVMPVAASFVRALGSPSMMYNVVFGMSGRIGLVNKVGSFRVDRSTESSVHISYFPRDASFRERNDNLHKFRQGQIASLTRLYGLPAARCVEARILGDRESFTYHFEWTNQKASDEPRWGWWGALVGAAVGLGAFVASQLLPPVALLTQVGVWALLAVVGGLVGLVLDRTRALETMERKIDALQVDGEGMKLAMLQQNKDVEAKAAELFVANVELENANRQLEAKNRELEANYAELAALNATLEQRVEERTRSLAETNVRLKETADELQEANGRLKETAEDLQESNQRLKEADELKDAFFAAINHELRTPLTLIVTPLEKLLETTRAIHPELVNTVETMQANALRLMKLINDLLDLQKFVAERVRLRYEDMDVNSGVRMVAGRFGDSAREVGLDLRLELAEDAGAILVDAERFDQVLSNLLSNAFKFTPSGGRVSVRTRNEPGVLVLEVEDTGKGIREDLQSTIFDRFAVGESRAIRGFGGTGLGLSLVKEIVEIHGGTVSLWSQEGEGTRFTVRFRRGRDHIRPELEDRRRREANPETAGRRQEDRVPEEARQSRPPDPTQLQIYDAMGHRGSAELNVPEHVGGRETILVVDDRAEVLQLLVKILGSTYNLLTATNGEDAQQITLDRLPDLVLSDVVMPRKDGFALCHDLKADERTKHIPIILLSAKPGERNGAIVRSEGIELGANDFVTKPFNERELTARVASQLKLKRMENDLRRSNDQLKELNAQLVELATTDYLTGLLNRREVEARIAAQFHRAREEGREMAVVMFDVDHFRDLNNTYGHPEGDRVLAEVARDTLEATEIHGFAGRYGGEEFILCFPGWSQDAAYVWAERLREHISTRRYLQAAPEREVTVSIGVAALGRHPVQSHERLIKLADSALYDAKHLGRNQVRQAE